MILRRCLAAVGLAMIGHDALRAQTVSPGPLSVVKRLFDGMRAGDSALVRSVFHPQARMITATLRDGVPRIAVESGIENFVRAIGTPRTEALDEQIFNERVQVDGPVASVWTDYSLFVGKRFIHCGIDHFLLVRNETGVWQILELADTRRQEGCERKTP